jgi:hypothetical protein
MLWLFQVKLDHPDMSKADTQKLPSFQSAVLRKTCQFRTLNRRWCKPTHCCKKGNALQVLTARRSFFVGVSQMAMRPGSYFIVALVIRLTS